MLLLIVRDLQFRAVRFALAVFGTALLFALVMVVSGVAAGFSYSAQRTVEGINEATWVLPEGSAGAFTSYAAFEDSVIHQIETDGELAPLLVMRGVVVERAVTQDVVIIGHTPGALGSPPLIDGRGVERGGEAVVAAAAGIPVGGSLAIGARGYEVVGTADGMTMFAGTPLVFLDIEDVRATAFERQAVATAVLGSGEVTQVPDGFHAVSAKAVADDAMRLIEDAVGSISIINVLLWVVAASVIGAVIYLSALERMRDFAVLKAVGARTRSLLSGLVVQAAVVAIAAAVIAIGLQALLVPVFPLDVHIRPGTFVRLPLLAIVVGLLASLGGLRRAVRVDPAAAFSGPGG